jgi:hypothetical protein
MFRTPPSTFKKQKATFMKPPAGRGRYYEDQYGELIEDEAFDRFPDDCEDETDSDGDDPEATRVRTEDKVNLGRNFMGGKRKRMAFERKRKRSSEVRSGPGEFCEKSHAYRDVLGNYHFTY